MGRGPVKIHRYDATWSIIYEKYQDLISKVIGDLIVNIEHVGSTSVEGLGAKPIIDITVTVRDIDNKELIPAMESLGFTYIDKYEKEFPFRRYFVHQNGDIHKAHVHIVPEKHQFFKEHIQFRDYLRLHSDARDQYHLLKTKLASKYKEDRASYQKHKGDFIEEVMKEAKEYFSSNQ